MYMELKIDSYTIKVVAYTTMLIDHIAGKIYSPYLQSIGITPTDDTLYLLGRHIGRIAFILFAFMIAQGMVHTSNKKKYLERLFLFAMISEIPFDLSRAAWLDFQNQNVFFTLFLGALSIFCVQKVLSSSIKKCLQYIECVLISFFLSVVAYWIHADYGAWGVLLILLFYVTKEHKMIMVVSILLMLSCGYYFYKLIESAIYASTFSMAWYQSVKGTLASRWTSELYGGVSLILLYFYDGSKGKNISKKITYLFYPVHLSVLGILRMVLFS